MRSMDGSRQTYHRGIFMKELENVLTDYVMYTMDFGKFVSEKINDFYQQMEINVPAHWTDPSSLTYFFRFAKRFQTMINMLERHNIKPKQIADLGSFYPYASYWFKIWDKEVTIDLFDIIGIEWNIAPYDVDGIKLYNFDLCRDTFPDKKYDLVIISEVLEHLPCNLFEMEKKIMSIMNGYLLVTYPLIGTNAKDYEKTYDRTGSVGEHLREFTEETVKLFFKQLDVLEKGVFDFPGYGPTMVVLYRK